jgi:hypothetical protein
MATFKPVPDNIQSALRTEVTFAAVKIIAALGLTNVSKTAQPLALSLALQVISDTLGTDLETVETARRNLGEPTARERVVVEALLQFGGPFPDHLTSAHAMGRAMHEVDGSAPPKTPEEILIEKAN